MAKICGPDQGILFDLNDTWYSDNPHLSLCFRETLLIWVTCGIVWMLLCVELVLLWKASRRFVVLWTKLGIGKIICLFIASLIVLSRVLKNWFHGSRHLYWNQFLSDCILLFTVAGLLCSVLAEYGIGILSSGPVFLSILTLVLSGCVELYSTLDDVISSKFYQNFRVCSFVLYFVVILVSFVLSCFALKGWISDEDSEGCPEQRCSFVNRLFFSWFGEKIWLGWKKTLELNDLWRVNPEESSAGAYGTLQKHLDPEFRRIIEHKKFRYYTVPEEVQDVILRQPGEPSLLKVLLKAFGWKIVFSGVFKFVNDSLFFAEPFLLRYFINFASDLDQPSWHGFIFVIALFVVKISQSMFDQQYYYVMTKLGMQIRTALVSAVYKKALKLSESARKETTIGEIVNLMSVDAARLEDVAPVLHEIWSGPFQIALALYLLYLTLGAAAFAGVAVFVAMIPLNVVVAHYFDKYQEKQMNEKDERVKFLTEILNGIKILKLYAWEPAFQRKIQSIRQTEVGYLKKTALISGVFEFSFQCAELAACIATFGTYVLMSKTHVLTPSTAFVGLYLFEKLQLPISILPMAITYCAMLAVSMRRLRNFFGAQELNELDIDFEPFGEHSAVQLHRASFAWTDQKNQVLRDLNLTVSSGSLVAVVGRVGSGKSSLLSAFCGELYKIEGSVTVSGKIALVPQQPWIQNKTLRQNVTFSREFNEDEYWKVIDACALRSDLDLLTQSDLTEIGERGINLSGGQKQRVSLARAIYHDSDVYLLDDPLSAVDVHVGKHIFENVIGPAGLLKRKTRILVTHGLTFLSQCDLVVVLKDGMVSEKGTYRQLLAKKGAFAEFLEEYLEKAPDEEIQDLDDEDLRQLSSSPNARAALERRKSRKSESVSFDTSAILDELISESGSVPRTGPSRQLSVNVESSPRRRLPEGVPRMPSETQSSVLSKTEDKVEDAGRQIDEEEIQVGKIPWRVYLSYLKASGRALFLYLLFLLLSEICYMGSTIWLQFWSDMNKRAVSRNHSEGISTELALGIYASFGALQALMVVFVAVFMALGLVRASQTLHDNLLANILRAPMCFFDTTPTGRIVNRCGKDMDVVDNQIPAAFDQVMHAFFFLFESSAVIVYATPWFLLPAVPMGLIYYLILKLYVQTSRQLRRLESVSRSPLYSHFQESLQGVGVIRAFRQQERFFLENQRLVDENNRAEFAIIVSNRWMGVRLDLLGNLVACAAGVLVVLTRGGKLTAGMVGLSLSNAFSIMQVMSWGVREVSHLETEIVAVERIEEYTEKETEADWRSDGGTGAISVSDQWPNHGTVEFDDYSLRYRSGLDLVLNGISCSVKAGEKVGVVGRTGAGKSSLTLALFRIVEAAKGRILIDGQDISELGLHDLRERLTIIPQDPVLFSGTIRLNLDPFDAYSDAELWSALQISHLKDFVVSLDSGLDHAVSEGGSNLSVGQRQLLCLARALLRRSKILILDEATAAVDLETDTFVQETIRKEFEHCTVITIAHRLNTIMDSDRILVLESGRVAEFDSPAKMVQDESSQFRNMLSEAGLLHRD